jgi:parallel beta-helix repeat protein
MSSTASTSRYVSALLSPYLIATGLSAVAIVALASNAQAQVNSSLVAANRVVARYTYRYVNPATGNDANEGSPQSPFRTITKALETALENTIIVLAPGTYSVATGEQFPIVMKSGVTLQGQAADRGQNVIIAGSGIYLSRTFARQNITLLGANRAGLRGVTVTNPQPQGYGLWIESTSPVISDSTFKGSTHDGVSILGSSAPILKNNYFTQNGANGITVYGVSRPEIIGNIFASTGFGVNIAQNAMPRLASNRITRNKDGIVVQGHAQPILRNNIITDNERDGLVVINQAQPHLGNTSDPGNNQFSGNGSFDINAKVSSQVIPSFNNQFGKTIGEIDRNSTLAAVTVPVRQFASRQPMSVASQPIVVSPMVAAIADKAQPIADKTQPTVTQQPIDTTNFPVLRLPSVPTRLAPKLRPVARPLPLSQISNLGDRATSTRTLPGVPTLRVSKPSVLGGTASVTPAAATTSIPIPVPAPESQQSSLLPTATSVVAVSRTVDNAAVAAADILPVPSGEIPVGDASAAPAVWQNGSSDRVALRPSLRYRVYVPQAVPEQLAALRSIVPDAFNVMLKGQPVIQAGAFNDRTEAEAFARKLSDAGLNATLDNY